ncbi:carboxypeptidase-like regulatory domain-containing protein [Aeromicrobium sp.]|uniref:carboxypeptidase-like regulatory domain-containing protein n=1 Tax=Aeromicrobium sp. TaxID=1871063 RepID=UPI0030BCE6A1
MRIFRANDPDQEHTFIQTSSTDPDIVVGLPPGDYKISSDDQLWYGGKSFASAKVVRLNAGTNRLSIPSHSPASLNSEVFGSRASVPYVRVALYDEHDPTEVVARINSSETGQVLGSVGSPAKARLIDPTGRYRSEWAQNNSSFRNAGPFSTWRQFFDMTRVSPVTQPPVPAGPWDASIAGKVIGPDLENGSTQIYLFRAQDDTNWMRLTDVYVPNESPDGRGEFNFKDLPAGQYKLRFGDGYWYGGGRTHSTATVITVAAGPNAAPDFMVPEHGDITGTVRSTRGTPVDHLLVTAYEPGTATPLAYTMTDAATYAEPRRGMFRFSDLPTTPVEVRVTDAENLFLTRWYGGGSSRTTAKTVTPSMNTSTGAGTDVDLVVSDGLVALTAPTVTGVRQHGRTLTAHSGKWSLSGASYTRRWYRSGQPIRGATSRTYKLRTSDKGSVISFGMVARKSGYPSASSLSRDTSRIR